MGAKKGWIKQAWMVGGKQCEVDQFPGGEVSIFSKKWQFHWIIHVTGSQVQMVGEVDVTLGH
jgi:hypothetical protein